MKSIKSIVKACGYERISNLATYLGIERNQTNIVVRPFPFTSEFTDNRFFTGDTTRGWSWDGSTASYMYYNATDNRSYLVIREFDGENFGSVQKERFFATGDVIRGWNWDGARASYIVNLGGNSELVIRDFDKSNFSSELTSRHISVSDPFRARLFL